MDIFNNEFRVCLSLMICSSKALIESALTSRPVLMSTSGYCRETPGTRPRTSIPIFVLGSEGLTVRYCRRLEEATWLGERRQWW